MKDDRILLDDPEWEDARNMLDDAYQPECEDDCEGCMEECCPYHAKDCVLSRHEIGGIVE